MLCGGQPGIAAAWEHTMLGSLYILCTVAAWNTRSCSAEPCRQDQHVAAPS
jgi:hypothetical protein